MCKLSTEMNTANSVLAANSNKPTPLPGKTPFLVIGRSSVLIEYILSTFEYILYSMLKASYSGILIVNLQFAT